MKAAWLRFSVFTNLHSRRPGTTAGKADGAVPIFTQAVLDRCIEIHERYVRRQANGRRAIVRFVQAVGLDFSGHLLTEADFTGGNFTGARLENANFDRASLYCADLRRVRASGASFFRADLRGVSLAEADLTGAMLDDADLREAVLVRSDAVMGFRRTGRLAASPPGGAQQTYAVDFSNASLKKVKLAKAKLKGANFSGAVLTGADLKGAALTGACFDGAVVTGVDVKALGLDPAVFANAIQDPSEAAHRKTHELSMRLQLAREWVTSNGACGQAAQLDGEDLRTLQGEFAGQSLPALSARGALAVGVNFAGAQLEGANFAGADLRDADFSGADLRGVSFAGAKLWHAKFKGAVLQPLALASGGQRPVNMTGALFAKGGFAGAIIAAA